MNRKKVREQYVYFISGMCYNCKVFDQLQLPEGYVKKYIEWHMPRQNESLSRYTRKMARSIDTSQSFILVGYSFGAVIIQEMNRFLKPRKNIIISSFKSKKEIPPLFQAVKKAHLARRIPLSVYNRTEFITNAFNRFIYSASNEELSEYMTYTDPGYIKWAIEKITDWTPGVKRNTPLYHIHGTIDQIFPYERLRNVFPVEGGDHLMLLKKADVVSAILNSILLRKEKNDSTY
jgi:pimeloyl-ACP methyl ester carboxylesterase